MSENRQQPRGRCLWGWALAGLFWMTCCTASSVWGAPSGSPKPESQPAKSPVVILSGEFFQAMEKLAKSEAYGDRQELLLEQIATAQRFLVKTNLALIEQNEKIIRLLEELNRRGQGEKR